MKTGDIVRCIQSESKISKRFNLDNKLYTIDLVRDKRIGIFISLVGKGDIFYDARRFIESKILNIKIL